MNPETLRILPVGLFVFMFGALVGSFLNVVIARLPYEDLSIVKPRSRCPKCGHEITWYENIPLISWLILRARCSGCKTPISARYPLVELMTALLFVASYHLHGLTAATVMGCVFAASLVAITFIDLDIWEIPDEISLPGIIVGALFHWLALGRPWYGGLLGAAIGGGGLWAIRAIHMAIRKREGLGLGDVKLIAMIGAFLGPGGLLPTILISSLAGTLIGGSLILVKRLFFPDPEETPEAATAESSPGDESVNLEAPTIEQPMPTEGEEEDDWEPSWDAVQFGPFLSLGGLMAFYFEPIFRKYLVGLDLLYRW